jgi:hypothetical protein
MRQTVQQRLNEAETYFQRNDYEMGANRIREVGYLLQSSPQGMSDLNPVAIASAKAKFLDDKLGVAWSKKDFDQAKSLITAEQALLTCLSNWQPQNPKWHYQNALLYKVASEVPLTGIGGQMAAHLGIQNNLHNEMDMRPLQNSIRECDRVLAMADSTYRQQATLLKNACESEIQQRSNKIQAFNVEYYRKLPKGMPPPGSDKEQFEMRCGVCGMIGHDTFTCPNKQRILYGDR